MLVAVGWFAACLSLFLSIKVVKKRIVLLTLTNQKYCQAISEYVLALLFRVGFDFAVLFVLPVL